jgi:hypothetical protein
MLNDTVKWSSLYIESNHFQYHWKTIYNEFNKWTKDNIFEEAFNVFTSFSSLSPPKGCVNDKYPLRM